MGRLCQLRCCRLRDNLAGEGDMLAKENGGYLSGMNANSFEQAGDSQRA